MAGERADVGRVADALRGSGGEAVRLLSELIRLPSPPGSEEPVARLMLEWLGASGIDAELVPLDDSIRDDPDYSFGDEPFEYSGRHNVVASLGEGSGGRSLILSTHLDVVPAAGWEEAFTPREENGFIFGRGACDAKGQLVAAGLAMRALREAGPELAGRVEAHFVVEEEVGGNGALALLASGLRADGALVLEPTGLRLHPAGRGALWFRLRVEGRSVHMGRRHEGVNAIEKMVPLIAALRDYETGLVEESRGVPLFEGYEHPVQLCIGSLHGGEFPSMVAGDAVLEGGVGFLPNKRMEDVKADLAAAVAAAADEWTQEHHSLTFPKLHNDAYASDSEHPFVGACRASARESGLDDEISGWNVSCDARLYHHRGGMPTVVFGPGDVRHAHSRGERVAAADVVKAAEVIARLVLEWCG